MPPPLPPRPAVRPPPPERDRRDSDRTEKVLRELADVEVRWRAALESERQEHQREVASLRGVVETLSKENQGLQALHRQSREDFSLVDNRVDTLEEWRKQCEASGAVGAKAVTDVAEKSAASQRLKVYGATFLAVAIQALLTWQTMQAQKPPLPPTVTLPVPTYPQPNPANFAGKPDPK